MPIGLCGQRGRCVLSNDKSAIRRPAGAVSRGIVLWSGSCIILAIETTGRCDQAPDLLLAFLSGARWSVPMI
jgi:hypothetical protein